MISNAQQNTLNNIGLTSSTPASVAYSLRLLSSSYAGPLVRIKVGTSFYDVYPDLITNKFSLSSKISASISTYNAAAAAASTIALSTIISGSTDATLAIWYDQSGNGVDVLSNTSTAKIITAGTLNTLYGQPTVYFSGSNGESLLTSSNTVNYSALSGATVNAVAQNVATTSSFAGIIGAAFAAPNPGYNISYDATIGKGYASDGAGCTYGTNLSSTNPQVITNIFVNTTTNLSNTYINGVLKANSGSTCSLTHTSGSKIYIGSARGYGPASFIGNVSEAIIFPKQLVDAERNPLETNQSSAYFSPCVTITSSASGAVCAGTNVTFTANVYNFTSTPTYQWYKNSVAINGANSSTYSTTTLTNNDVIKVSAGDVIVTNSLIQHLDANNASSYTSGNTWTDLTGNGKNGTIVAGSSGTVAIATEGNIKSFNFTKGTTYISAPVTKTASMSFNVWAKNTDLNNAYNTIGTMLFNAGASGTGPLNGGPDLFISGNKIYWNTYDGVGNPFMLNGTPITTTTAAINDNNWHHFAVVVDALASSVNLYIDGVFKGTAVYKDPSTFTSPTALFIGGEGSNNTYNLGWIGNISAFQSYSRALSLAEVVQNFNAKASFFGVTSSASTFSNSINVSVNSVSVPTISVVGDACINKTTLTTGSGLGNYAWYKDNVVISGATSNTYTPSTSGAYQVQVSNGTCSSTSTVTTIYTCGRTADGRMVSISSSTTLVTSSGEINNKYGVDERGLLLTKPFANTPTGNNPVTSGLILYLDATRTASYGGTGNTWTDISGLSPAGSATLVGSPVFGSGSTTNGSGSFTFGSSINAATTKTYTIDNEITYIAWVNPSQSFDGGVIVRRTDPSFNSGATSLYLANSNLSYDWDNANWSWRSNLIVPNNQWSMIVISVNAGSVTAYLCNANGINSASSGRGHSSLTSKGATNFYIAYDPYSPSSRAFKGKMGTAMVYSVALSSADINSIYNAQKVAFGL